MPVFAAVYKKAIYFLIEIIRDNAKQLCTNVLPSPFVF